MEHPLIKDFHDRHWNREDMSISSEDFEKISLLSQWCVMGGLSSNQFIMMVHILSFTVPNPVMNFIVPLDKSLPKLKGVESIKGVIEVVKELEGAGAIKFTIVNDEQGKASALNVSLDVSFKS